MLYTASYCTETASISDTMIYTRHVQVGEGTREKAVVRKMIVGKALWVGGHMSESGLVNKVKFENIYI